MTAQTYAAEVAPIDGTVTGAPKRWLRLEAAVLLAGSLIAFSTTHQPWWLIPLTLMLPDVVMAGYLGGTRLGAVSYNIAHTTPIPAAVIPIGWWQDKPLILAVGLVWLARIGMDRTLGYGLKLRRPPRPHPPRPTRPTNSTTVDTASAAVVSTAHPTRTKDLDDSYPYTQASSAGGVCVGLRIGRRCCTVDEEDLRSHPVPAVDLLRPGGSGSVAPDPGNAVFRRLTSHRSRWMTAY
jgi:Domain of unknown function (DUF4260)